MVAKTKKPKPTVLSNTDVYIGAGNTIRVENDSTLYHVSGFIEAKDGYLPQVEVIYRVDPNAGRQYRKFTVTQIVQINEKPVQIR